jgi:flagellar basal body P-ring formation protein FlgA
MRCLGVAASLSLYIVLVVRSPLQAADGDIAVPMPAATIPAGTRITEIMLVEQGMPASYAGKGIYEKKEDVIGKHARRPLAARRPILLTALKDADLVMPGRVATIVFVTPGLEISARGMPLQPGKLGERVSIRNIESGSIVEGAVAADGTVRVDRN